MKYKPPITEGFYWAKLVLPTSDTIEKSADWEVVEVYENDPNGHDFRVFVGGVQESQDFDAFIWGPKVEKPGVLR